MCADGERREDGREPDPFAVCGAVRYEAEVEVTDWRVLISSVKEDGDVERGIAMGAAAAIKSAMSTPASRVNETIKRRVKGSERCD